MSLSLIVAMTRSGVIGRDGQLPWRLSADLKRFKALTMGHHLLMGRKTWDSLGRPLPGRTSVVISRQRDLLLPPGVLTARSLDEALLLAGGDDQPFVIGGSQIFALALPRASKLLVTWVEADVPGEIRFPAWDAEEWSLVKSQAFPADGQNEYPTTFCVYERTGHMA